MAITIKTVTTHKELKTFVRYANKLYKGNPYYVPSMPFDDMNTLSKDVNGAFEFCEAEYFLAYKDDKLVGRVAAIINHKANKAWDVNQVRFGWFDFIDDIEVSKALLDAVISFGKSHGVNQIAVLIIRTTGDESIEKYSYRVATARGVGQKGKDNGILITIATDDRADRIEVGKGLEGDVTDSRSGRILRSNDVTTAFRDKRWYDGADSIVSQVQECIRTKGKSAERIYSSKDIMSGYSIVMTVLGVAGEYLKKKGKILYWIGAAVVDYFAYTRFHVSLLPMLLITIVMGLTAYGIIRVRSSSSSSSGGSSSFGGGSFGGGGASGDW